MRKRSYLIVAFWSSLLVCATSARAEAPAYLVHLPGIGGESSLDRALLDGLADGGLQAEVDLFDWTGDDPGINALWARQRNDQQAQIVADRITQRYREDPTRRILMTGHSGGAGIAVWALEKLPADVMVQTVMLFAPALSPTYDLSSALRHVQGLAFAFTSPYDVAMLGAGTRLLGTIDGVKTDAAGLVGFIRPDGADPQAYHKLVAMPYDTDWMYIGNIGDHIGPMTRPFARQFLAGMLLTGQPPTTQPATEAAP